MIANRPLDQAVAKRSFPGRDSFKNGDLTIPANRGYGDRDQISLWSELPDGRMLGLLPSGAQTEWKPNLGLQEAEAKSLVQAALEHPLPLREITEFPRAKYLINACVLDDHIAYKLIELNPNASLNQIKPGVLDPEHHTYAGGFGSDIGTDRATFLTCDGQHFGSWTSQGRALLEETRLASVFSISDAAGDRLLNIAQNVTEDVEFTVAPPPGF